MRDQMDDLTPNERAWLRFLREVSNDSDPTSLPCVGCSSCGTYARLRGADEANGRDGGEEWLDHCASPDPCSTFPHCPFPKIGKLRSVPLGSLVLGSDVPRSIWPQPSHIAPRKGSTSR